PFLFPARPPISPLKNRICEYSAKLVSTVGLNGVEGLGSTAALDSERAFSRQAGAGVVVMAGAVLFDSNDDQQAICVDQAKEKWLGKSVVLTDGNVGPALVVYSRRSAARLS